MATLYAQPTKEWVIPAKPKPGRKPKRDDPVAEDDGGGDCKTKKVQNRAAQRAFRERKQSQLADLQARLTQYEQGEIERNVALQNVAKKLKEENERLKSDNEKLREEGDRVREENLSMRNRLRELQEEFLAYRRSVDPSSPHLEFESLVNTRKRSRNEGSASLQSDSPAAQSSTTNALVNKRKRGREDMRSSTPLLSARTLASPSARRMSSKGYSTLPPDYVAPLPQTTFACSPSSAGTSSRPSLVMSPCASENSSGIEPASFDGVSPHVDATMQDFSDKLDSPDFDSASDNLHMVDCGFCSKDSEECVCREVSISLNQLIEASSTTAPNATSLLGDLRMGSANNIAPNTLPTTDSATSAGAGSSILDNLPPVQPGVPLRLRRSKRTATGTSTSTSPVDDGPVHLTPVPQLAQLQPTYESSSRPVCSGDPSNCAACADDPFGRAFCTALASGGICRDDKCMRCPKSNRPPLPKTVSSPGDKGDKGKGKSISMDMDSSSGVGIGMGMGMSMESGMLLCCGDPKLCGGGGCDLRAPSSPKKTPRSQRPSIQTMEYSSGNSSYPQSDTRTATDADKAVVRLPPFSSSDDQGTMKTWTDDEMTDQGIPTNDAWARLKSHPNIAFADLALLADVVAGRTKCTGPRVLLSPIPEPHNVPGRDEIDIGRDLVEDTEEERSLLHPQPVLVSHDALVRCGRERMMRVQAEGVRDALAMLDVQRPA